MSTLGDRLFAQFGGDVPADPQAVAQRLVQQHGSGRAAARYIGRDEKTIRRWLKGETRHSDRVEEFAKDARAEKVENHTGPVELKFRYAKRDRDLKFGPGQGSRQLMPGTVPTIKEAYIKGDKEAMAEAFINGIDDPFYQSRIEQAHEAELVGAPGTAGEDSGQVGVIG